MCQRPNSAATLRPPSSLLACHHSPLAGHSPLPPLQLAGLATHRVRPHDAAWRCAAPTGRLAGLRCLLASASPVATSARRTDRSGHHSALPVYAGARHWDSWVATSEQAPRLARPPHVARRPVPPSPSQPPLTCPCGSSGRAVSTPAGYGSPASARGLLNLIPAPLLGCSLVPTSL